jgi:hypothetical protein
MLAGMSFTHAAVLGGLVTLGFAVSSTCQAKPPNTADAVIATGFESPDKEGLFDALVRHDRLEVVEGQGVGGGAALKATYRGSNIGSERIVTRFKLPEGLDEASLQFDVKFDEDFQFVRGGKLHGLGPDRPITGGKPMKPDGWSARAMFDADGLRTYAYCQNKDGKYGEGPDRRIKFEFKKERYYAVTIYTKLNDPERDNGSMRIYVNGKGVADHRGIRFRSVGGDHTRITHLLFSTFHGGNSPRWAPKDREGNYIDVHAYFDNFAVYDGLNVRRKPAE